MADFPHFENYSELIKLAGKKKLYVELSNRYFIPVNKSSLKVLSDGMKKNNHPFSGVVIYQRETSFQIRLDKPKS